MATIVRPNKEGSVPTYQQKVALGFVDILASEMDADLDTIYAAWNGGADSINVKDGSITYAKLAPDAKLWADSGTALVLGANFTSRPVALAPTGTNTNLIFGARTIKHRLIGHGSSDVAYVTSNATLNPANTAWVQDDVAKTSWMLALNEASDAVQISRVPAGGTATSAMCIVDGTGALTTAGNILAAGVGYFGTGPIKGHVDGTSGQVTLGENNMWGPQDTTKVSWQLQLNGTADRVDISRRAANAGNGVSTNVFTMDSTGSLYITGPNATKSAGTLWINPSDRRLKDEIADYPTGLDAVLQLQPRTFVYNGKGGSTAGLRGCGFIADEVATVMPEMVGTYHYTREGADDTDTEYATVDQSNLILALVNAVHELAARVDALEAPA